MIQAPKSESESPEEISQNSSQSVSVNSDIVHPNLVKQLGSKKVKIVFTGTAYKKKRNEMWEEIGKSVFTIRKSLENQRKYEICVVKTTGKKVCSVEILQYNFIEIDQIQKQIIWVSVQKKNTSYKFVFENVATLVLIKVALEECVNKYKESLSSNKIPTIQQSIEQLQKRLILTNREKEKLSGLEESQKLFRLQKLWVIEKGTYFHDYQKQKNKPRPNPPSVIVIPERREQKKEKEKEKVQSERVQKIINPLQRHQQPPPNAPAPPSQHIENLFQINLVSEPEQEQNKNVISENEEDNQEKSSDVQYDQQSSYDAQNKSQIYKASLINLNTYTQILRDHGIYPMISKIKSVQSQDQVEEIQNQSTNATRLSLKVSGISQQQCIVAYEQMPPKPSRKLRLQRTDMYFLNPQNTTFHQSSIYEQVFFYSKKQLRIQQLFLKKRGNKQKFIQNSIKNHPLEIEKEKHIFPRKLISFENDQKILILTFDGKLFIKDLNKRSEQYCSTKQLEMLYIMIKDAFVSDICRYQQKDKSKQDSFLISTHKSIYKLNIHKKSINKLIKNKFIDRWSKIKNVASFPSGDYAAGFEQGQVSIFSCETRKQIKQLSFEDSVYCLQTSKNGLFLLVTLSKKLILINTNPKLFNQIYRREPNSVPVRNFKYYELKIQKMPMTARMTQKYKTYNVVDAKFDMVENQNEQYIVWARHNDYYVWSIQSIIQGVSPSYIKKQYKGTITHIEFRNNNSEEIIISTQYDSIEVVKNPRQ